MNSRRLEKGIYQENVDEQSSFKTNLIQPVSTSNSDAGVEEEISFNKFLNFMKVSCHVNDVISVQTNQQRQLGKNISEDFHSVITNDGYNLENMMKAMKDSGHCNNSSKIDEELFQRRSTVELAIGLMQGENVQAKLYKKLDYIVNEGMVDSVLSFICPIPVPASFPRYMKPKHKKELFISKVTPLDNSESVYNCNTKINEIESSIATNGSHCQIIQDDVKPIRKLVTSKRDKKEPEVVIHVCDEDKNSNRDFSCSQRLLVNQMGYFAEVTAGQKLDEMDISVHCDIQIFDWLIKWMKLTDSAEASGFRKTEFEGPEGLPHLDANNVISILVSAGFLQMEPLVIECLSFCHARLCDVVRSSINLSRLNDSIITRLAAMFTNLELEMVRDKKERLAPRLWIKLIQSLCEPEPEALRGHFYSLAGLFRCSKCGEHLTNTFRSYIACQPNNTRLTRWGQLSSGHVRDSLWNINNFIAHIFKERRSWRHVYWKLWGHCHFLYCYICERHFPVYKMTWCRFHPSSPNYLESITEDFITSPIGRYPCCGKKAYRFEVFPEANGCQFRDHSVVAENERERQILQIMKVIYKDGIICDPPAEDVLSARITPCWIGLPLTPQHCRQGLLPSMNAGELTKQIVRRLGQDGTSFIDESCSDCSDSDSTTENTDRLIQKDNRIYYEIEFSSDGCESEQTELEALRIKKLKKKPSHNSGRYWCGELSARSNQDHQREYEEKAIKNMILRMNKNNGLEQNLLPGGPVGGFYVRLETEWRDQLKHRSLPNLTNSFSISGFGKFKYK
ncbi:SANT and BTB domain regulator of class switch recombination isoform X1 [Anastrepha ludens]|uniref:SANT and BTB domain regulator of class switch recombination isoform X1 n=2 Tax=Anastrepha ludens TaxID=28586 RepID=UPI0023AF625E|nr:SANT and BTB domain regulator of class switch recombination isoform X1 [Anastrepha ludens]